MQRHVWIVGKHVKRAAADVSYRVSRCMTELLTVVSARPAVAWLQGARIARPCRYERCRPSSVPELYAGSISPRGKTRAGRVEAKDPPLTP